MGKILQELKIQMLPLLFAVTLTSWSMSSLFGLSIIITLIGALVLNGFLFVLFQLFKNRGLKGVALFFGFSFGYFIAIVFILAASGNASKAGYLLWFITTQLETGDFNFAFWLTTILLASYGFSSTVFYFTNIKYRISILFLVGIIPFMLHSAKTQADITFPFVIFAMMFFMLCVESNRRKNVKKVNFNFIYSSWYIAVIFLFVSLTTALSYITPKPYTVPKVVYLDSVISQVLQPLGLAFRSAIQRQNSLSIFNPRNNYGYSPIDSISAPLGNNVIFEVEADEPLYFRVQSWDKYLRNRWTSGDISLQKGKPIESYAVGQKKLALTVSMIERLKDTSSKPKGFQELIDSLKYPSYSWKSKKVTVKPKGIYMSTFLNPSGIINLETAKGGEKIYINENACCFGDNLKVDNDPYSMEYFSQSLAPASREFKALMKLNRSLGEFVLGQDKYVEYGERPVLLAAKSEMDIAYNYYTSLPGNLPGRIKELAEKITAGKTSDYQKALAIEQYFYSSGFKYSLTPPAAPRGKDYNDFFLFESKRGVCVHFASAMVLLARESGLPARYVEGYVASELDSETGRYIIREKNAHAFPEIYISGYGWMAFEPTVGISESNKFILFFSNTFENIKEFILQITGFVKGMPIWLKTLFIPVFMLLILLTVEVFIKGRERSWRKRVQKIEKSRSIEEIFKRIVHLFSRIDLDMKKYETPAVYSDRIFEESGIILSRISDVFNRSKYGGIEPTGEDITSAVEAYDAVKLFVKKHVGKMKSWTI